MMRSLYAGVTGLRAHQVRMDVIGNNIANVNTTAFKASRVNFADMYSATMSNAVSGNTFVGGVNPKQVGLGVTIGSIDVAQTQGALQATGKATDLAVTGNGFFVTREGGNFFYTRDGRFDFDADGYLVNPTNGMRVQGWLPNAATGLFPTRDATNMTDLRVNLTDAALAKPSTQVSFDQALNANSPVGTTHSVGYTAVDSLGRDQVFTMQLTKVANNAWDIRLLNPDGTVNVLADPYPGAIAIPPAAGANMGRIQFNPDGSVMEYDNNPATTTPYTISITPYTPPGANAMALTLDLNKVIQPALVGLSNTASTMRSLSTDGYTSGTLVNVSVDARGMITGYYSNGQFREIAQVALANFTNPAGLSKEPGNNWSSSPNSGLALIGAAQEAGRGAVTSTALELSNVDIAAEFSNMIITQRGFQANSRVITTTDEMLQEVMNLKR